MAALHLGRAALTELDTCVHCGLCLPTCPTYRELGQEPDSPRGRIYLIRALLEGRLAPEDGLLAHIDLCLGCLACETACPSGVRYGVILEEVSAATEPLRRRPWPVRWLRRFLLHWLLPVPARLALAARLGRLALAFGLDALAPRHLRALARAVPIPARPSRRLLPGELPPLTGGHVPGAPGPLRVGLLVGCVQDVLLPDTNLAAARVLALHGCTVVTPSEQVCCGALAAHAGDLETARDLARRNVDEFTGVDAVVANAAGCGAHLKQYGHLLAGDPAYADRARAFAARVRDFSELMSELAAGRDAPGGVPGALPEVAYQDACHLAHAQGIRRQPRDLLARVCRVKDLPDDSCCGSAGFYNLVQPEMAGRVLARKVEQIRQSGVRTVVTANPGCLLQLRVGVREAGLEVEVVHIASYLARRYEELGVRAAAPSGGEG